MQKAAIEGTWKGYYEYGEGYLLPYFGQRVSFEITIDGDDHSFTGTTREEPSEYSVPSQASVKGFIDNNLVSFIKTYPINPIIDEHNQTIQIEAGQLNIEHLGIIDHAQQCMYGSWQIEDKFVNEEGQQDINYVGGIWLVRKTN